MGSVKGDLSRTELPSRPPDSQSCWHESSLEALHSWESERWWMTLPASLVWRLGPWGPEGGREELDIKTEDTSGDPWVAIQILPEFLMRCLEGRGWVWVWGTWWGQATQWTLVSLFSKAPKRALLLFTFQCKSSRLQPARLCKLVFNVRFILIFALTRLIVYITMHMYRLG